MATIYAYKNRISYSQNSDCDCNVSASVGITLSKKNIFEVVPELLATLTLEEYQKVVAKSDSKWAKEREYEKEKELEEKKK